MFSIVATQIKPLQTLKALQPPSQQMLPMSKRKLRNKLQSVGSGKYKYNIKCRIIIITPVRSRQQIQQLFLQKKIEQTKRIFRKKLQSRSVDSIKY